MGQSKNVLEANKALLRRSADEIWTQGKLDVVDEIVSRAGAPGRGQAEGIDGREGLKAIVKEWRAAFPDLSMTVDDQFAEGNTVVTLSTLRGTHKGTFRGLPPTGNAVEISGHSCTTVEDNMIVGDSVLYDLLSLVQQLGVSPDEIDLSGPPR